VTGTREGVPFPALKISISRNEARRVHDRDRGLCIPLTLLAECTYSEGAVFLRRWCLATR